MSARMAERCHDRAFFHVVRQPDRYACGMVRRPERVIEDAGAHTVEPKRRCLRVGCQNDYAKADSESRRGALTSSVSEGGKSDG